MDELHMLHDAIQSLWKIIKKYNNELTAESDWEPFLDECDLIGRKYSPEVRDLAEQWVYAYAKYADKRAKRTIQ